eukprot:CAMPEP_0195645050 /NCGR_PEP_ID=MMETSP0815-20121206/28728_1 /TAXON_ID=97485 /ORGANISM="Prymnesium parvum, Strain Texoma1" /LENGTH=54 /DNA_ID=CAMNT_0040788265 /DNA_START=380 /DNA_END=542 /DNA_ORIENTATION=-
MAWRKRGACLVDPVGRVEEGGDGEEVHARHRRLVHPMGGARREEALGVEAEERS